MSSALKLLYNPVKVQLKKGHYIEFRRYLILGTGEEVLTVNSTNYPNEEIVNFQDVQYDVSLGDDDDLKADLQSLKDTKEPIGNLGQFQTVYSYYP